MDSYLLLQNWMFTTTEMLLGTNVTQTLLEVEDIFRNKIKGIGLKI